MTTYIRADQFIGISEWPISWLPGIPLILGCTVNSRLLHWLAIYYVKHIKLGYGQSFTSLSVVYHKSVLPGLIRHSFTTGFHCNALHTKLQ